MPALRPALSLLFSLSAMLSVLGVSTAQAQTWPTKPVRIIAPFPPGSSADITCRLFAPKLAESFGQQSFIVENRVGASGNIGAESVARAAPDGYTLLGMPAAIATSVSLYKNLTFNLEKDFDPVAMMTSSPYLLVASPKLPVKTVKELVALAKSRGGAGKLNFASTGTGGGIHLTTALFMMGTGIDMVHIPYKGGLAAVADISTGQVDLMFGTAQVLLAQTKAGRVRALAITSAARSPAAPDIPTVAEAALPGFESASWIALLGPRGLSRDTITRLNGAVAKIVQTPDVQAQLAAMGAEAVNMSPAQLSAYIREEIVKWSKVVAAAGVTAE